VCPAHCYLLPPIPGAGTAAGVEAKVPGGYAGATSTLWRLGEPAFSTATHPDLAAPLDRQLARGSGPVLDAVRTGAPADCRG
jgi:hypothetical protein